MTNNSKGGGHTGSGKRPITSRQMQYAIMRSGRVRIPGKKPEPPIPPSNPLIPKIREEGWTLGLQTDEQKKLLVPVPIIEQEKYHKLTFLQKARMAILNAIKRMV